MFDGPEPWLWDVGWGKTHVMGAVVVKQREVGGDRRRLCPHRNVFSVVQPMVPKYDGYETRVALDSNSDSMQRHCSVVR